MRLSAGHTRYAILLAIAVFLLSSPASLLAGKVSPALEVRIADDINGTVTAVVFLNSNIESQADMNSKLKSLHSRSLRYKVAHSSIRKTSNDAKSLFDSELRKHGISLNLKRQFHIANAVLIEIPVSQVSRLTELEAVSYVVEDTLLELINPIEESGIAASAGVESHLTAINADYLWSLGYSGAGRFVISFDTGVNGAHSGLVGRWRGETTGDPSQGWFDPQTETNFPSDHNGHGTHVMGLMAGVVDGDTVGVAPDVEWGCASVVDRGAGFSQTISDILAAFEWASDPDGNPETTDDLPDAINHSWGVPAGIFDKCDVTFHTAIDNLEALGIVNIFAAGNEGPDPKSIRNPADRSSSPLNTFSVGAIDHRQADYPVTDFSSRGPANCDSTDFKPEVVAPGKSLVSLDKDGGTKLMSGTSMAAPLVTGAVALLRQYNPDATVEQIKHALIMSAVDVDTPGEDNNTGFGLIDLREALNHMPVPNHATILFKGFEVQDDGNMIIEPEENVTLSVEVQISNYDVDGLWGVLSTYDTDMHVLTDSAYFGTLATGAEVTNDEQPFEVMADALIAPGKAVTFRIDFYDDEGNFLNNAYFVLVVAQSDRAMYSSITNGTVSVGTCNYGAVGLGRGSMIDLNQAGYSVDTTNFLSEFALIIADETGRVSDAARDVSGDRSDNDFLAAGIGDVTMSPSLAWGDHEISGVYSDNLAEDPLEIEVAQSVSLFDDAGLNTAAFARFQIHNSSPIEDRSIAPGVLVDFDFPNGEVDQEMIGYNAERGLAYYYNVAQNSYVGIALLSDPVNSFVHYSNPYDAKIGLSEDLKHAACFSGTIAQLPTKRADYATILSAAAQEIEAGEEIELAVVMLWAPNESELFARYDEAWLKYMTPTYAGDEDDNPILPTGFTLSQNYPNPFNPETVIEYSVRSGQRVTIEVFNTLGQRVGILVDDYIPAGNHSVRWDGTDFSGNAVASGVYFYRLRSAETEITRKMMLLK